MINFRWWRNGSGFLTINKPFPSIDARSKYQRTSQRFFAFFEGRVPWERWANTRRRKVQLCCAERHAVLRNGMRAEPGKMSDIETELKTDVMVSLTNLHIWQEPSEHSCGWREPKSLERLFSPLRWHRMTLWTLKHDKNVDILADAENWSFRRLVKTCTHGLLSVRACSGWRDSLT